MLNIVPVALSALCLLAVPLMSFADEPLIVPENWQQAADVGIDGILTDYPFELAVALRHQSQNQEKR